MGLLRAEKTLPTISYYRDHPDELPAAIDAIRSQRATSKAQLLTKGPL